MEYQLGEVVPEMDHLEKLQIFSKVEIKKIMRKRRFYLQKIIKGPTTKKNFIQGIGYETDLLDLIILRKGELNLPNQWKNIDMTIASRVNKLYKLAVFRYYNQHFLWLQYITFCKKARAFRMSVTNMLVDVLTRHRSNSKLCNPKLWKLAARWEYKENKSVERASQYLMKGLRLFPSSKVLYAEIFRMELLYADMKLKQLKSKENKDKQDGTKAIPCVASFSGHVSGVATASTADKSDISVGHPPQSLAKQWQDAMQDPDGSVLVLRNYDSSDPAILGQIAQYIYETASKKISDVSFLIRLLKIASNFKFTKELQERMATDLLLRFTNNEITWDTLAQRELVGLHIADCTDEEPTSDVELKSEIEKIQYNRIVKCLTMYRRGLQNVKTAHMWELYLDTLIQLNHNASVLTEFKRKVLLQELHKADKEGTLNPSYYIHWAGLYTCQCEELSFILEAAAKKFQSKSEFSRVFLNRKASECDEETVTKTTQFLLSCMECKDALFQNFWMYLSQHPKIRSMDSFKKLVENLNNQGPALYSVLNQIFFKSQEPVKDMGTKHCAIKNLKD